MREKEILSNYEYLVSHLEEIGLITEFLHDWLCENVDPNDRTACLIFFQQHNKHLALLSMMMEKISDLLSSHKQVIIEAYKGGRDDAE